jgi:uncharacterized protein (TIGR02391 family)
MPKQHLILPPHLLESICKVIANTETGLTGTEIRKILGDCSIIDTDPQMTKWKRLYNAFVHWQNVNHCSNHILKFIQAALQPVRYIGREGTFQDRRNEINKRLSFIGLEIGETGKYRNIDKTSTISQAEQRASKFKYKLEARNAHQQIFIYCGAELLVENYFHSIFEAVKSIADRIRELTGLTSDGVELINTAFSIDAPLLKINSLSNSTDRSEHLGFVNIIRGLFGVIRNPTAHEPKIKFVIEEEEALDVMVMVSFTHKRLDRVIKK